MAVSIDFAIIHDGHTTSNAGTTIQPSHGLIGSHRGSSHLNFRQHDRERREYVHKLNVSQWLLLRVISLTFYVAWYLQCRVNEHLCGMQSVFNIFACRYEHVEQRRHPYTCGKLEVLSQASCSRNVTSPITTAIPLCSIPNEPHTSTPASRVHTILLRRFPDFHRPESSMILSDIPKSPAPTRTLVTISAARDQHEVLYQPPSSAFARL